MLQKYVSAYKHLSILLSYALFPYCTTEKIIKFQFFCTATSFVKVIQPSNCKFKKLVISYHRVCQCNMLSGLCVILKEIEVSLLQAVFFLWELSPVFFVSFAGDSIRLPQAEDPGNSEHMLI